MSVKSKMIKLPGWLIQLKRFMALDFDCVSHAEKLVATLGGIIGVSLVSLVSFKVSGATGAALIVPSMGASAVLLFAVPHGKLSQPWSLIGGHVISAVVGVICYQMFGDTYLSAGLAVGFAIGAMHIFKCIHPPGGATALAAIIGGPAIHSLGYSYILSPILLNTLIILIVAIVFNGFFPWRRYPAAVMMRFTDQPAKVDKYHINLVDKKAVEQAISDMDLVMDVTIEDLQRVIQLSFDHSRNQKVMLDQVKLGHFYTNGLHGTDWSVRSIIDESKSSNPKNDMVIYRVVEGQRFNTADSCTRQAFAEWAAREVFPNN
ncbi:MAG: hypothetical protein DIZ80_17040 [endosymbiont of Galathealinum brachiosum]|uniref:HPP transmembrane region domain-containing protein n=1 Tax=endosymbiont of Galathealinum brachiosum TaxID=2200906 RepID=A0A370D6U1_9GAMM|nr:MAG: hypothetical protein DIZ80_17040 [endosymbiont of Galathealinum brachiosum]